ncbi:MAG TPA: phosphate ABC transporter permease subunit PstC [Candidatus Eisenbergiella intestinigallinarum]|jgi:phosphate transport system permease protein|uniref:Phosphate transport system permease protein n=1 Tax=Candidatus Eisenbergiella intestinigallinarum TaxID=2838549 RepID=A0A9D2QJS5_9FIRM|nr:phosphate ABC transporter permease subunit PstC [Candidatus Eisenbergiella intestinigallinarum]
MNEPLSIIHGRHAKSAVEKTAKIIFTVCAFFAILAVFSITLYMIINGTPALFQVGLGEILFGTVWEPTAEDPAFGILFIILTSIIGTALAILIGVPIGVLTAVFLAEVAPKRLASIVKPAVELLAGIPSVIYGLLGIMILNPLMYKLELAIFRDSETHQFTGGANLISAVIVLAIMILPTVINISESALKAVPAQYKSASLALGASHIQTIFKVMLPAAKSGIITAIVLGVGRAIGEAMAITLVSGSSVNFPLPFNSVRFLTTAIVSEMGYASGLHRQVLFTIGLVLFVFIMIINVGLTSILKAGDPEAKEKKKAAKLAKEAEQNEPDRKEAVTL